MFNNANRPFKLSISVFLLSMAIALSGCLGISQPTEEDIRYMSMEHFENEYPGLFLAYEFQKDNGYKQNDTHYVAEVTIYAEALQSLEDYAKNLKNNDDLSTMEKLAMGMQITMIKLGMPDFKAKDEFEFKRHYLFIKTDNGWLLKKQLEPEE